MRCVLGFDGGGTKTECVLMDETGRVLSRGRSGPSNPFRVGVESASEALQSAARDALQSAGRAIHEVAAVVAGLAGTTRHDLAERMRADLSRLFPGSAVKLCTDFELALEAVGESPAIVLVAGTGSAAIGRDAAGRVVRIGGYGPQISDEGSAYDIGRKAVAMALRDRDRRGSDSPLGSRILRDLGFTAWDALNDRAQTSADEVFPKIFPIVIEAAAAGDECAQILLRDAAKDLAALVRRLIERLALGDVPFILAKTGGMIGRKPIFDEALDVALREGAPRASISSLSVAPAEAAARLALELLAPPKSAAIPR